MNRFLNICLIGTIASLLAACTASMTTTHVTWIKNKKLASGQETKVGYQPVKQSWRCREVRKTAFNWGKEKFKGNFSLSGPYGVIEDEVINYANQHHIRANYIYIKLPTEFTAGGLESSAFSDAYVTYYQCKNPPPAKMF